MADHVVILQHGIIGAVNDLRNVGKALWFWHHGRVRIILSDANAGRTLDGVVQGGTRLAQLIKCSRPKDGGSLSIICHSLGGIYARCALEILENEGWLAELQAANVEIANFVTLASPHLGIAELEAIIRHGNNLLGSAGVLPQTVRDLDLQTPVLLQLSSGAGLKALDRFSRRVAYGNWDDDMWVRTCSALILPSLPTVHDEPLSDGEPRKVNDDANLIALDSIDLSRFPLKHHENVRSMLENLHQLKWDRYIVLFPFEKWTGTAHIKICNHPDDKKNCGEKVLAHICQTLVLPDDAEAATKALIHRSFTIQERSVPKKELADGNVIVKASSYIDGCGCDETVMESFSCFALQGIFHTSGGWVEENGKNLDEARTWIQEHDGKHSHAVVKVRRTAQVEEEEAEWYHAWLPSNNWHKTHIMEKVKAHYPKIKGNIDAVLTK